MDLKLEDVAELLNVCETTILGWIKDGKIPCYRINEQHRFSRTEIENWMISQKQGSQESTTFSQESTKSKKGGVQQFNLYRAIHKGGVFHDVPGNNKEEVIRSAMKMLTENLNLDADVLTDLLLDRENLMPTALNHGVGVPHTRDFLLNEAHDVVAVAFPKTPIEYGALDGEPVHTLFFLFACQDKRHLQLLAKIAHLTNDPQARAMMRTKPEKEALLEFVRKWEGTIKNPG